MRLTVVLFAALVLGWSGVARAQAQDDDAEARQHFKAATGHYAVGEFAEAAAEYEAAFKLHQDPALLFDAAQARRLGGDNAKALILYKNFLHLYPNSSNVPTVREQIDKLEVVVAAEQKAKTAPPTNTVEPTNQPPPPANTTQPTTPPPAIEAAQTAPPPPSNEKPPIYKKWWFWTAIGAVVVVAVVVPIAVIETRPAWNNLPAQGPGSALTTTRALVAVRW